jgi:hypothetical protein
MSVRSLVRHLSTLLTGVVIGGVIAAVLLSPTDVNTLGVVRVDVVAPPADVNCGSLLYVQVTGVFDGAQHVTGACVSRDVATDARTDDVAIALANEN